MLAFYTAYHVCLIGLEPAIEINWNWIELIRRNPATKELSGGVYWPGYRLPYSLLYPASWVRQDFRSSRLRRRRMQMNDVGTQRGDVVVDLAAIPRYDHRRAPLVFYAVGWRPDGRTLIAAVLLLILAMSNVCLTTATPVPGEYLVVMCKLQSNIFESLRHITRSAAEYLALLLLRSVLTSQFSGVTQN